MAKAKTVVKVEDEVGFVRTVNTKKRIRDQLEIDIDIFLAEGGAIEVVETNVTADPPERPATRYGGRPI